MEKRVRTTNTHQVTMQAGPSGLAFGVLPRAMLPYLSSLALAKGSPEIELDKQFSTFLAAIGQASNSGGDESPRDRVRKQLRRLWFTRFTVEDLTVPDRDKIRSFLVGSDLEVWWAATDQERRINRRGSTSTLRFSAEFYRELERAPIFLHFPTIRKFSRSPALLDTYALVATEAQLVEEEQFYSYDDLFNELAGTIPDDHRARQKALSNFKTRFKRNFDSVKKEYEQLNAERTDDGLRIKPSDPHVDPKVIAASMPPAIAQAGTRRSPPAEQPVVQGVLLDTAGRPLRARNPATPAARRRTR